MFKVTLNSNPLCGIIDCPFSPGGPGTPLNPDLPILPLSPRGPWGPGFCESRPGRPYVTQQIQIN